MNENLSKQWAAVVDELGPTFAARAEACDREAAFVSENYAQLKERQIFSAGIPSELGGGGLSHAELGELIRRLAHYCPSTALALSMHTHLIAAAVWRHTHGQNAAPLFQKVVKDQLVLVSTGAGDWLESNGNMVKVEGGYQVTAQKRFASGSPALGMALTSARYDDPVDGPLVLHFGVSLEAKGVSIGTDWDSLGMRATGSHTLSFEGVFIPEAAIPLRRPRGKWHPSYSVVCTVALPLVVAAYVGVAEKAVELTRAGKKGSTDAAVHARLGELENTLFTAQALLREQIANARNYDFSPDFDRANASLKCKTIASRALRSCLEQCVALSGGAAFYKKHPLERLWRDVQGVQFHPMQEGPQTVVTGRVAIGLDPV